MFTRLSNFSYGNYRIANITADTTSAVNIAMLICIQKNEKEFLKMVLGSTLYNEFISNLEFDLLGYYKLRTTADEKWSWLLNGKDNWGGLVYTVATIENNQVVESIIAPYIYFNWALENRTLNLGTGEGRIDANGSTQESTFNKRVDAWNQIVQSIDYGYPNDRISLNQFLKDNEALFPTAKTINLTPMNYYDI